MKKLASGFYLLAPVLGLCLPNMAVAADPVLQLRQENGTIGAPSRPNPQYAATQIQSQQWTAPTWLQSGSNSPTLSANAQSTTDSGSSYGSGASTDFGLEAVIGWDSEHIFRGQQLAKQNISAGAEATYGNSYAGVWAVLPTADRFNAFQNRIDLYAGTGFDLAGTLYADIGVNGYIRTDDGILFATEDSVEAYAGLSANGRFSPAVYAFYDFILERYTFEASAEYILPFGRNDLVAGAVAGYSGGDGVDYGYFQADIEARYNINRNTSIGLAGHLAASTEPTFLDGLGVTSDTTAWFGLRLKARN